MSARFCSASASPCLQQELLVFAHSETRWRTIGQQTRQRRLHRSQPATSKPSTDVLSTTLLEQLATPTRLMATPSADAIVDYAEPKIAGDDENTHWVGDLHYSYSVNGNSYSASHYFRASGNDDAEDLVKEWRSRRIVVHYFPGNPSRSVFIPQEQHPSATMASSL